MNPLHIISSIPTIQKTASSKERGSLSLSHHREFLRIPQYSFYLIHKQAFATWQFIYWTPEVPKPSSLYPSTFKESTTYHFMKFHHHQKDSTKQRKRAKKEDRHHQPVIVTLYASPSVPST
jgi:hypothetical protein